MVCEVDVIVIGAGALGLTTARELRRAGKSVLVLEQADPGAGLSSHTSRRAHAGAKFGDLMSWGIIPAMAEERRRLLEWAPQYLTSIRTYVPYSSFRKPRAAVDGWMRFWDAMRGDGPAWKTELNVEAPTALQPLMANPGQRGVSYLELAIDDLGVTRLALSEAVALGCLVISGARVNAVEASNGSWTVLYEKNDGAHEAVAPTVVNAAGLSADPVLDAFGFTPAARPAFTRATHIWIRAPRPLEESWNLLDRNSGMGLLITPDGPDKWMIGCTDSVVCEPGSVDEVERDVDKLLEAVSSVLREPLERSSVVRVRSGLRPRPPSRNTADVARSRQYVLRRDLSPCGARLVSILYGRLEWMNRIGAHVARLV